jgi:hypothetical protein
MKWACIEVIQIKLSPNDVDYEECGILGCNDLMSGDSPDFSEEYIASIFKIGE